MSQLITVMQGHHKHCDEAFAEAEEAAQKGDWPACAKECGRLVRNMLAHFEVEENLLFPAFESATGMSGGPTQIMRMEHRQMRDLFEQLEGSQQARDANRFAGAAETLLVVMQQHNMKEENILYPMCEQALGAKAGQMASEFEALLEKADA